MPYVVHSRFTVRSYEVDSYSHLNNGVYVSWFEQGRLDHLASLGFSYDGFAERHEWFVVGRTEVDFRRPLSIGDTVELTTSVEGFGRTSVRFTQTMRLAGKDGASPAGDAFHVSEARTIMVFTGRQGSIPIPTDFRAAVEAAEQDAATRP